MQSLLLVQLFRETEIKMVVFLKKTGEALEITYKTYSNG